MSQQPLQFNILNDYDSNNLVNDYENSYVDSFSSTNESNLSTTYEDAQNMTSDYVTVQNNEQSAGQYYQASPQHVTDESNDSTEHISIPKVSMILSKPNR